MPSEFCFYGLGNLSDRKVKSRVFKRFYHLTASERPQHAAALPRRAKRVSFCQIFEFFAVIDTFFQSKCFRSCFDQNMPRADVIDRFEFHGQSFRRKRRYFDRKRHYQKRREHYDKFFQHDAALHALMHSTTVFTTVCCSSSVSSGNIGSDKTHFVSSTV